MATIMVDKIPDRCLICYSNLSLDFTKREGNNRTLSAKATNAASKPVFFKQLDSVFILRHLLEIPAENLQAYLMSWGSPETWISVCSTCKIVTEEARKIHDEMVDTRKRFGRVKQRVIEAIKRSRDEQHGGQAAADIWKLSKRFITDQSRNFVSIHTYAHFTDPFIFGDKRATELAKKNLRALSSTNMNQVRVKAELDSNDCSEHFMEDAIPFESDVQNVELGSDCADVFDNDEDTFTSDINVDTEQAVVDSNPKIEKSSDGVKESNDLKGIEVKFCDKCHVNFLVELFDEHNKRLHQTSEKSREASLEETAGNSSPEELTTENPQQTANDGLMTMKDDDHRAKGEVDFAPKNKDDDTNTSNALPCLKCPRKFYRPMDLWEHQNLHKTSPFHCFMCLSVHKNYNNLRFHMWRHHPSIKMGRKGRVVRGRKNVRLVTDHDGDHSNSAALSRSREIRGEKTAFKSSNPVSCPACANFKFKVGEVEKLLAHWGICEAVTRGTDEKNYNDSLTCPFCSSYNVSFSQQTTFLEHVLSCNGHNLEDSQPTSRASRLFECNVCPSKRYFTPDGFLKHFVEHRTNIYKCTRCPKRFPVTSQVNSHWKIHHRDVLKTVQPLYRFIKDTSVPEMAWWCNLCDDKFVNEDTRDEHINNFHEQELPEKRYLCQVCSKAYACEDELKFHEGTCHVTTSLDLFNCDICKQQFSTARQLRNHRMRKHRVDLLVCEECGTECNSFTNLNNHLQLHRDVRNFICQQCGESFVVRQYLKNHILKKHGPRDAKINPLVCPYCDKAFHNKSYLKEHIAGIHNGQYKMHCHVCNLGCQNNSHLKKHLAAVHKIGEAKRYPCTVEGCNKSFPTPNRLKNHITTHTGNPQFHCQFCSKGFHIKTQLRRHEQIHSNSESKPYQCELCAKRFPVRNYLYIHMKSHRKDIKI